MAREGETELYSHGRVKSAVTFKLPYEAVCAPLRELDAGCAGQKSVGTLIGQSHGGHTIGVARRTGQKLVACYLCRNRDAIRNAVLQNGWAAALRIPFDFR